MFLKRLFLKYWKILLSTLLYQLAFPPFNYYYLVFVALIPWLFDLKKFNSKQAIKSGFIYGFLFYVCQMSMLISLVTKWTNNYYIGLVTLFIAGIVGSLYFVFLGWIINFCFKQKREYLIPLVWAGVEAIRSFMPFLAFPWGELALPLWSVPKMIQHASLGMIYLVSSWVVVANFSIMFAMQKSRKYISAYYAAVFLAFLGYSYLKYNQTPNTSIQKTISIGQPGLDFAFSADQENWNQLLKIVPQIIHIAKESKSDLLVLPEGLTKLSKKIPPYIPFEPDPKIPVIFAGQRRGKEVFQSAFGYYGNWTYTDKTRLVVFGEYVPLRNIIPFLSIFQLPSGDITPGSSIKTLKFPNFTIGALVCFEGLFAEVAYYQSMQGANLLVQMSNDSWFYKTTAYDQLKAHSIWRAVESGLPLARSGSEGVTMAVDHRGNILKQASNGIFEILTLKMDLPKQSDAWPYRYYYIHLTMMVVILLFLEGFIRGLLKLLREKGCLKNLDF